MKKILLAALLITVSGSAMAYGHAYGHGYGHRGYHGPSYRWVAPVIIGGAMGYGLGRYYTPPPVIVQQPPVVVQQAPVIVQDQNCTEWREIQYPNGSITRERICR